MCMIMLIVIIIINRNIKNGRESRRPQGIMIYDLLLIMILDYDNDDDNV